MRLNSTGRDIMKIRFRVLVGSVALAVGSVAQAAIDDDNAFTPGGGDGGGELFLSVIDRGAEEPMSYVRNLSISARDFLASDATYLDSLSFAADENLQTLLANPGGTVAWNIAAIHNTYGENYDDMGYLTTAPVEPVANEETLTGFVGMSNAIAQAGQYLQATRDVTKGDSILVTNPNDHAFYDGPFWGNDWHTSLHATEAGLDENLGFYYVATNYSVDGDGSSSRVVPLLGEWMLATSGTLTYKSVPLPAAVWLLASALLGMAGMAGRRSAHGENKLATAA